MWLTAQGMSMVTTKPIVSAVDPPWSERRRSHEAKMARTKTKVAIISTARPCHTVISSATSVTPSVPVEWASTVISQQPSAISQQSSVDSHRSTIISHQPSVNSHRSTVFAQQSSAIDQSHGSSVISQQSSLKSHRPSVIAQ